MFEHCVVDISGSLLIFILVSHWLCNICCWNISSWQNSIVANNVAWTTSVWLWKWSTYQSVCILLL